ncbi:hypothetical protein AB7849_09430 [Rhodanobacter sp. 115]|uniref:hypothetical protein n=1 Tax=Rhodanobacter sp. FW021-MT20 TaxID=1162282 RepID=UPI0034E3B4F6
MQAQSTAAPIGTSSDAFLVRRLMAQAMWPAGETPMPRGAGGFDHPMDAEDFARCRLMLERMPPIAEQFRKVMPNASKVWSTFVDAWDDLCVTLDDECPNWRKSGIEAPNTTAKIRQLIRRAIIDKVTTQDDLLASLGAG